MMALCDVWLAQSPRRRIACWCGYTCVLVMIAALSLIYPLMQERDAQREAFARQHAAVQSQWRELYQLAAQVDPPLLMSDEQTIPFTPLALQSTQARLIHWIPSAQGGEISLRSTWEAIPSVFSLLADRDMRVNRFSLSAEGEALLFTLQVEHLNDG